jgi:hypothetical protein
MSISPLVCTLNPSVPVAALPTESEGTYIAAELQKQT